MLLTVVSRRMNLPTIVTLLAGGFLLGPQGLGWVQPESLGSVFPAVVSLAVGIILFEGGLTLNLREFAASSRAIRRLLTIGVLVTWLGGALVVWLIFRTEPAFALLAGSLVIVTGPTVIVPLLKRIQAAPRVASILHWEGVLIDAIGVFIAILCFEWIVGGQGGQALLNFLLRVLLGAAVGWGGGWLIQAAIWKRWVPEKMVNAFALASGILLFGISEAFLPESGLLSVTLAGLVIGWKQPIELKEIRAFKAEITDLLIGMLFILLVARLEWRQFLEFGWPGLAALALLILAVRPANVFLSTMGAGLNLREKIFLSWVAPRGIVAASMASLFALSLGAQEEPIGDPQFLETFTYSVICTTVVLQGFSAGWVARGLGLKKPQPTGWLLVGAHLFARRLAALLQKHLEVPVLLIDSNSRFVGYAKEDGLTVVQGDALEVDELMESELFQGVAQVLSLTDNAELNRLVRSQWGAKLGRYESFGWRPAASPVSSGTAPGTSLSLESPEKTEDNTGDVFVELARPSVIAGELDRREASLEVITVGKVNPGSPPLLPGLPLMIFRGGKGLPLRAGKELGESLKSEDRVLVLHRSDGFLRRGFQNGGYRRIEAEDLDGLYRRIVEVAAQDLPALSVEDTVATLQAQEKSFPSVLGKGLAFLHLYSSRIEDRMAYFFRLERGLSVMGKENQIRMVIFVISPQGDAQGHLNTLAEIARCCRQQSHLASLERAESIEEVLQLV